MASTYTDNAGIEQPGPGEQSGSWGTTTNRNFDIIDRCLNGVGEITLNGTSSVLNTADGAESDGHYRVLLLGGSPTGTHTVTISPNDQDKLYFVHNDSGQSAVFTQGSGGNVTIANGRSKIIYADGNGTTAKVTDFSSLIDASSNATSGVPSGTKQLFVQTSAPTGWTKETSSHDESAIRVTTGNASSGGSVDFTTLFTGTVGGTIATSVSGTVAGHALQISQMPAHRHFVFRNEIGNLDGGPGNVNTGNFACFANNSFGGGDEKYSIVATGNEANVSLSSSTGSTQNHSHGWSGTATSTFSNGNDLAVKYVDVIIATKD